MPCRFVNKPLKEDGVMVKAMREQGGIPFCLTNVPQTMKVLESIDAFSLLFKNTQLLVLLVLKPDLWSNIQSLGQDSLPWWVFWW